MLLRTHKSREFLDLFSAVNRFSNHRTISRNAAVFKVSEEIQNAVWARRPVVALETTIYTHGKYMEYTLLYLSFLIV